MNSELVRRLILYLVYQLQEMESPISTIRLIKFLYLIDLEHYNRFFRTLSGIEWIMWDHGPYFHEWRNVVKSTGYRLDVNEVRTERGPGRTFRVDEEQNIEDITSYSVQSIIDRVLKKWADEDLDVLLEQVYISLPIQHGERGQSLEFSFETDHLLLEDAINTASEFDTLDEFIDSINDDQGD